LTVDEGGLFRGQSMMQAEGEPLLIEPPKRRGDNTGRKRPHDEPETVVEGTPG
jgi:hypothetical protein